jgi:hypothetical protein
MGTKSQIFVPAAMNGDRGSISMNRGSVSPPLFESMVYREIFSCFACLLCYPVKNAKGANKQADNS